MSMTKPAKSALAEGKVHSSNSSTFQHFVGDVLLTSYLKDTTEAS